MEESKDATAARVLRLVDPLGGEDHVIPLGDPVTSSSGAPDISDVAVLPQQHPQSNTLTTGAQGVRSSSVAAHSHLSEDIDCWLSELGEVKVDASHVQPLLQRIVKWPTSSGNRWVFVVISATRYPHRPQEYAGWAPHVRCKSGLPPPGAVLLCRRTCGIYHGLCSVQAGSQSLPQLYSRPGSAEVTSLFEERRELTYAWRREAGFMESALPFLLSTPMEDDSRDVLRMGLQVMP